MRAGHLGLYRRVRARRGGPARRPPSDHPLAVRPTRARAIRASASIPTRSTCTTAASAPRPASPPASTWRWRWSRRTGHATWRSASPAAGRLPQAAGRTVAVQQPLAAQSAPRPLRGSSCGSLENLADDLSVEALAARAAMSPRNFARVFLRAAHAGEVRRAGPRRGRPPAARRRRRWSRWPAAAADSAPPVAAPSVPEASRHRAGRLPAAIPTVVARAASSDRRASRSIARRRRRRRYRGSTPQRGSGRGPRQLIGQRILPRPTFETRLFDRGATDETSFQAFLDRPAGDRVGRGRAHHTGDAARVGSAARGGRPRSRSAATTPCA